jgi:hypothetical protein
MAQERNGCSRDAACRANSTGVKYPLGSKAIFFYEAGKISLFGETCNKSKHRFLWYTKNISYQCPVYAAFPAG